MKSTWKIMVVISVLLLAGVFGAQADQPQKGGVLKVIYGPGQTGSNLGYAPEMSIPDEFTAKLYAETLVSWDGSGEFVPLLAESWDLDPAKKTVTFHLRKGVKFHDGTVFNAEVVRWNAQLMADNHRFINGQFIESFEAIDEYTFRFNLNKWINPSVILHSYGYGPQIYSPAAFKKKGKDWCYTHFVTTGPFKFVSFERDVALVVEKFDGYWRKGYPLLDRVEISYVADPMTASAMMQAAEADLWYGPPLREAIDLEKRGFKYVYKYDMFNDIIPDNKTEGSVFKNKAVREAVEYAIDRQAIAKGLGYGKMMPMNQMAPQGTQGFDAAYKGRPYDPAKAKALLAEAGYPNGFSTKMLVMQGNSDMPQVVQKYLNDVGIKVEIDVADPGRFFGKLYKDGWDGGLMLFSCPADPEYAIGWLVHFGPQPIVFYSCVQWPPMYSQLVGEVFTAPDADTLHAATKKMIRFVGEEAMLVPLTALGSTFVAAPYVHTDRLEDHMMVWHAYNDWVEKH